MKKTYTLSALLCASVLSSVGCIEENFEKITPANDGDEIVFGARAGFESSDSKTRTVYSGETYEIGSVTFERIDWLDKGNTTEDWYDMIEVYSPEASNGPTSHYEINHNNNKNADSVQDQDSPSHLKDYAYLTRAGESSLQWNGDGDHHFYAMYPSSKLFVNETNTTLKQGVKMEGTTLRGFIPAAQAPSRIIEDADGNYVAVPNMKYAYMAAKTVANRIDGNVALTFVPIVTAVQIELQMPASVGEGSVDVVPTSIGEIQVVGKGIAGAFTADLSDDDDGWTDTYPTCTNDGEGTETIQVTVFRDDQAISLAGGKTLTFTVFLRPGTDVSNLEVRISPTGSGYVGKTMSGVTVEAMKKNVFDNLYLPAEGVKMDASKWMTQIDDEVEFKKLSLPGTGGSFSYNYKDDTDGYFRSQHTNMTIAEQWKVGIRAFEIVSDRIESGGFWGWGADPASLAGTPVTCNKNSVGINVGTAMEQINNQLNANPQECAVVIFTYQPEGASPDRNATKYAQSLKLWFDGINYKDKFVLYRPDITLGEVRGKILVIVRLNQSGEKDSGSFSNAVSQLPVKTYPFLLVDGCGTAKDKWGARGYTITVDGTTTPAPDISNSADVYIEQYMETATINPSKHANVGKGPMNFAYSTNTDAKCWYHEWARVLPDDLSVPAGSWKGFSHPAMYWFESYTEKLSNAVETFKMAISDEFSGEGDDVDYVFVNTLSGYMATEATKGSPTYSLVPSVGTAYGGDGGDIAALATRLNSDFYREVLGAGMEQATGPTGIVMMDYVNNKPTEGVEFDGSYYLPGVIIANNFKFD